MFFGERERVVCKTHRNFLESNVSMLHGVGIHARLSMASVCMFVNDSCVFDTCFDACDVMCVLMHLMLP